MITSQQLFSFPSVIHQLKINLKNIIFSLITLNKVVNCSRVHLRFLSQAFISSGIANFFSLEYFLLSKYLVGEGITTVKHNYMVLLLLL